MSERQPIATAPKDGTRIQVFHELDPYSEQNDVTAVWEDGQWACSEWFIDPRTMYLYKQPTHWAPLTARRAE